MKTFRDESGYGKVLDQIIFFNNLEEIDFPDETGDKSFYRNNNGMTVSVETTVNHKDKVVDTICILDENVPNPFIEWEVSGKKGIGLSGSSYSFSIVPYKNEVQNSVHDVLVLFHEKIPLLVSDITEDPFVVSEMKDVVLDLEKALSLVNQTTPDGTEDDCKQAIERVIAYLSEKKNDFYAESKDVHIKRILKGLGSYKPEEQGMKM